MRNEKIDEKVDRNKRVDDILNQIVEHCNNQHSYGKLEFDSISNYMNVISTFTITTKD